MNDGYYATCINFSPLQNYFLYATARNHHFGYLLCYDNDQNRIS